MLGCCYKRIVTVGDSTTAGNCTGSAAVFWGYPYPGAPWPANLQARLPPDWCVINEGISGNTTGPPPAGTYRLNMLDRASNWLGHNAGYILIGGSVNDLSINASYPGDFPPEQTESNIEQMCSLIVGVGATPIIWLITPYAKHPQPGIDANNARIAYAENPSAGEYYPLDLDHIDVIDFYTPLIDPNTGLYNTIYECVLSGDAQDPHPNPDGNQVMANSIPLSYFGL